MASQETEKQPTKEDVVSQLIAAVQSGEYNLVKSILGGKGHNFAAQDIVNTENRTYDGWTTGSTTALLVACKKHSYSCLESKEPESLNMVKLLLDHGADPDIFVEAKHALHLAVQGGDLTLVRLLLEGNASVNQTDWKGRSATHLCCDTFVLDDEQTKLEILTTLIKYKADVNLQTKNGYTPLHYSCDKKRPDLTKALLENGALATMQDNSRNSPLHLAVRSCDLTSVRKILEEGKASANQTNNDGQSALHLCCKIWDDNQPTLDILTTLIKYQADVNLQDVYGKTPMHCSCASSKPILTQALLKNGALATIQDSNGDTPLHLAVFEEDLISAGHILEDRRVFINQTNDDGKSAMHLCCEQFGEDSKDILETLIKHNADVNLKDHNGYTPMHLSCKANRPDLTTVLLENGALATTQDSGGNSPLHLAVRSGGLTSVRKMLEEGQASVNQTNNAGQSALHLSCDGLCPREHSIDILITLIQYNADVNLQDNDGCAPMHLSCKNHRADVTMKLLENGALALIQDNRGDTPLHLAVRSGSLTLVRKMLEVGQASVNQTNNDGQSALHLCCNYTDIDFPTKYPTKYLDKLTTLINHEADVNLQDKNGKTPLHLSCVTNADDVTTTLVEKGALVTTQDNTGKCPLHISIEKDNKQHNERENSLTLRILHLVDSRLTKPNENIESIIEAYEVTALSTSCYDLIGCMRKATELREEHDIKKIVLEPMECYGFAKEWETIEELKACGGDEKQLKLQATLAGERIYQGKTEVLVELLNDHLVTDVLQASKSEAGKLLEHHLDIWRAQKSDSHRHNFVMVVRAWKNMIDEHFELFKTRTVVRFVRVTIESMSFGDRGIYSDFFVTLLSSTIALIMKLYRRNWQLEGISRNEQILAHELLSELMVSNSYKKPLQHLITELNFRIPQADRDVFSRTPYDSDLMKMLLESGIKINEVDSYGNTILHSALSSIQCSIQCALSSIQYDLEEPSTPLMHSQFSQEVVDQSVESITLLLEKGVYPNARNKQYETARSELDNCSRNMAMGERINDILQQYEQQYAMTLKQKAAVAVKEAGVPYDSLPEELVNFVDLQGDLPMDFYEYQDDESDYTGHYDDYGDFNIHSAVVMGYE